MPGRAGEAARAKRADALTVIGQPPTPGLTSWRRRRQTGSRPAPPPAAAVPPPPPAPPRPADPFSASASSPLRRGRPRAVAGWEACSELGRSPRAPLAREPRGGRCVSFGSRASFLWRACRAAAPEALLSFSSGVPADPGQNPWCCDLMGRGHSRGATLALMRARGFSSASSLGLRVRTGGVCVSEGAPQLMLC